MEHKQVEFTKVSKLYPCSSQLATCMAYKDAAREYWRCAYEYYGLNKSKDKFTMLKVVFYLIGLSLEIYFKAFIILAEDTVDGYKQRKKVISYQPKIRHNLKALYEIAKKKGLSILDKKEEGLIYMLNERYYSKSSFRYKQGIDMSGIEIANFLEIKLPSADNYFAIMLKMQKEAEKRIVA